MPNTKKYIAISTEGRIMGENHVRAKLTDEQVDLLRDLYEEGFVGYRTLVRLVVEVWGIEVTRNTIKSIVNYHRRNATHSHYRTQQIAALKVARAAMQSKK